MKPATYISSVTGVGKVYSTPLKPGEGVGNLEAVTDPAILARIEVLGKMNDRRTRYHCRKMKGAMIRLAREYKRMGMPAMALAVREEAEDL